MNMAGYTLWYEKPRDWKATMSSLELTAVHLQDTSRQQHIRIFCPRWLKQPGLYPTLIERNIDDE